MHRFSFILPVVLFLSGFASASSKNSSFPVKVVKATKQSQQAQVTNTSNCNFEDYDGYCNAAVPVTDVATSLTLKANNGDTLHVSCDANASNCAAVPVDQTVNARFVKNGLEIRYVDENQKERKEVYEIVPDVTTVGD